MTVPVLEIDSLEVRHPGLTAPIAATYAEAAYICLDRHHTSPAMFSIHNSALETAAEVAWTPSSDRVKRAWANETDATESGAYGVSLAAIEHARGLVAVARAETMTGADYYVAPSHSLTGDLEESIRLEVSGVDKGDVAVVNARLREKVRQAGRGRSTSPAIAAVVGFKALLIKISDVELVDVA